MRKPDGIRSAASAAILSRDTVTLLISALVMLLGAMGWIVLNADETADAMVPLQGNIAEKVSWQPDWVNALVLGANGKPLPNAQLYVDGQPANSTNSQGLTTLPLGGIQTAVVVRIDNATSMASAYTTVVSPTDVQLAQQQQQPVVLRLPLAATLNETRQPLDTQWHRLGDGSYSQWSSGSGKFQQQGAEGPAITMPLPINTAPSQPLTITIGAIIGLDTATAHQLEGSSNPHTASPLIVSINGQRVGAIRTNGTYQSVTVPANALHAGKNALTITTGWHIDSTGRQDWDDMALQGVWVE